MRAKIRVSTVTPPTVEVLPGADMAPAQTIVAFPVSKSEAYPADGSDENNTFAKWSPSGEFKLTITNPALSNRIKAGDEFYVDFTPVSKPIVAHEPVDKSVGVAFVKLPSEPAVTPSA